jgi:hypothetical protein
MKLVSKDGKEIKLGDKVTDFRGDEWTLVGTYLPGTSGGGAGGRVELQNEERNWRQLFYPGVINAEFKED